MQKEFLELSFRLGQLVLCLSVTPPIATATGLGFNASSSFGLLRGLTWSLPWSPLVPLKLPRNILHGSTQSTLGLQLTFFLRLVLY